MLGNFQIGQKPRLTLTYKDAAGDLTDPSSPSLQVEDPTGADTTYTTGFSQESLGVWTWTFPARLTLAGRYFVRALDDGSTGFAEEDFFVVAESAFATLP